MNRTGSVCMTAIVAGALAGGAAAGDAITETISIPITNDVSSDVSFRALTVLITDAGEFPRIDDGAHFVSIPVPSVMFQEGGVRGVESITSFADDQALRFVFSEGSLWEPGESLVFSFTIEQTSGAAYDIDLQFEPFIPSPGTTMLAGIAGVCALHRRRR